MEGIQNLLTLLLVSLSFLNSMLRIFTYYWASLPSLFGTFKFPIGIHLFLGGRGMIEKDKCSIVFIPKMAVGLHRDFKCIVNV